MAEKDVLQATLQAALGDRTHLSRVSRSETAARA
jgi:hypothetical protein